MDVDQLKHRAQGRLILVSLTLLFLYHAGAKIVDPSLFGAKIQIANQRAINEVLWVLWVYYFFRSYQYFRDSGRDEYRASLDRLIVEEFAPRILRLRRDEYESLPSRDPIKRSVMRPRIALFPAIYLLRSELALRRHRPSAGGQPPRWAHRRRLLNLLRRPKGALRGLTRSGSGQMWGVQITMYLGGDSVDGTQGRRRQFIYLRFNAVSAWIKVVLQSIFTRGAFSENYGPLIIGLIPLWYIILAGI
jgi:hypothetical protein